MSIDLIPKTTQTTVVVIVIKMEEVDEVTRVVVVVKEEVVSLISLPQNTDGCKYMQTMDLKVSPIPL